MYNIYMCVCICQGKFLKIKNLICIKINGTQFAAGAIQMNSVFYIQCLCNKCVMHKTTNRTVSKTKENNSMTPRL